ncbi:MAG: hypothetical protein RBS43_07500 [Candidatus Cloacimonas sp.]|jgi:hypothetical protein|nr:hypothetical protein [Candidatus Cloacimonas sp.]
MKLPIKLSTLILAGILLISSGSLFGKKTATSLFPFVAYSNETRLMGGAFGTYLRQTERDSISSEFLVNLLAIYSANKQFQLIFTPQVTLHDDLLQIKLDLRGRNWPDRFYGVGNNGSPDIYEQFVQKQLKARLEPEIRLWQNLYVSAKTTVVQENMDSFNPQTIPLEGNYHGLNMVQTYYGYGATIRLTTVDSDFYPTHGVNYSAQYTRYIDSNATPETINFGISILELNNYISPAAGTVLALQSSFSNSYHHVPFSFMPELGGQLRAYNSKRYIDKTLLAQRTELRVFPSELGFIQDWGWFQGAFFQRSGFVIFSEIGQVAESAKDMRWQYNHFSNGFGLRFRISEALKLNIRTDFAFGSEGFNLIVQGGEAF